MKIKNEYPPNIELIRRRFTLHKDVVFTYGDTLYVPNGASSIPTDLLIHEETHERQQKEFGVDEWWSYYFVSDGFRTAMEIEAYQNQYNYMRVKIKDRNKLNLYLHRLANDLSSAIYGNVLSLAEARKAIQSSKVDFDFSSFKKQVAK